MAKIKERKNIVIERNIIEKFLMKVKDFVRNNKKIVRNSLIGFLVLCVVFIGGLFKFSIQKEKQLLIYENILNFYEKNKEIDKDIVKKTIEDLKTLSESSNIGFVDEMVYYFIGNLLYKEKNFKESKDYLLKYIDISSSDIFSGIALQKVALAFEEMNNIDEALVIYNKLEDKYSDSIIADQFHYNIGRIHSIKNNAVDARKYFNKVISMYPQSVYAKKAKKRLFLIGLK